MPHIHTGKGQHDMTISAYIMREFDGEWLCLVHMHKKFGKLLQVGGHIELTETPWSALIHEVREEAGYDQDQLTVLQMAPLAPHGQSILHPVPINFNTHRVNDTHYHSDLGYACIVQEDPRHEILPPESPDIRWLTIRQLEQTQLKGEALFDVVDAYKDILENILPTATRVPAIVFSISEPDKIPV
ncbi:MAG: NUDIX domain-containing protein [Candidatus Saccharimonadales bacterium]